MTDISTKTRYGFVIPGRWQRYTVSTTDLADEWFNRLTEFAIPTSEVRLRDDLADLQRSLNDSGVVEFFTYARLVDDKVLSFVLTCSLLSTANAPDEPLEEFFRHFLARGDEGWDVSPAMMTLHQSGTEEYMRAERLIQEAPGLPWRQTREVRYAFRHPEAPYMALLCGTTPNVSVIEAIEQFDEVANSFFWIPEEFLIDIVNQ
jgi:hypothetical protein